MCITLWDPSKSFSRSSSRIFNSTTAWLTKRFLFLIIFIATCWFVLWSNARITCPKLPFPITSKISYLKAMWSCSTYKEKGKLKKFFCWRNQSLYSQFYNCRSRRHIRYSMWNLVLGKFCWLTVRNTRFYCKSWPPRIHLRWGSFHISLLTLKREKSK